MCPWFLPVPRSSWMGQPALALLSCHPWSGATSTAPAGTALTPTFGACSGECRMVWAKTLPGTPEIIEHPIQCSQGIPHESVLTFFLFPNKAAACQSAREWSDKEKSKNSQTQLRRNEAQLLQCCINDVFSCYLIKVSFVWYLRHSSHPSCFMYLCICICVYAFFVWFAAYQTLCLPCDQIKKKVFMAFFL